MSNMVFKHAGGSTRGTVSAMGLWALLAALFLAAPSLQAGTNATAYVQRNLVSDGSIPAAHVDPNLINPWGIALTPTGMVWIAGNGTSASTVYDGEGDAIHTPPLVVDIPGGSPTGIVANQGPDFPIPTADGATEPSVFIFATEAGIISGWNMSVDPAKAVAMVDNAETGASYTGVAIAGNGSSRFLYAADFRGAKIDVFDNVFQPITLAAGAFTDPNLPAGFAPFGIHNLNGSLYVTYAKQDPEKQDSVAGPGLGYINVFDADGRLIRRLVSRGRLNAPWGLALAPADFGPFSHHLLVANYGDGKINAYNPGTGEFKGHIRGADNRPLAIEGLWGICFGNGVQNQPTNALFFTAGPAQENQGLYGRIDRVDTLLAANVRPAPPAPQPVQQLLLPQEATQEAVPEIEADYGSAAQVFPLEPPPVEKPLDGAKASETALQQVEAHKGGEGEKPLGYIKRTPVDAEGQGEEDETARQDADIPFTIHVPRSPD